MRVPLSAVPKTQSAIAHFADAVREYGGSSARADLDQICRALSIQVRVSDIENSEIESLLIPCQQGGFRAVVGRRAIAGFGSDVSRHRFRFRLAHEIAHSLFFEPGAPPRRMIPHSSAEEAFCDEFARALLVPSAQAIDVFEASRIFALSAVLDASLQVIARAVCSHAADKGIKALRLTPNGWACVWSVGPRFFVDPDVLQETWREPGQTLRHRTSNRLTTAMRRGSVVLSLTCESKYGSGM